MKEAVILTTVFPAARPFLSNFFDSIQNQSLHNFDLFILNDNLNDLQSITSPYTKLNYIEHKVSSSPQVNRLIGIKEAIRRNYKYIIFADSDDYFDINRVEVVTELLKEWDVVVNELVLVNNNEQILNQGAISKRFENGRKIEPSDILEKNIFGFSNTAARISCFENIIVPSDIIALDWYIFSFLLHNSLTAVFTTATKSYYRQYSGNMIGLGSQLDEKKLLLGIEVKERQFNSLATINTYYKKLLPEYLKLGKKIREDCEFRQKYIEYINQHHNPNLLWWEDIISDVNL